MDVDIIEQMLPILSTNFPNATTQYVYIYEPTACTNGGTFSVTTGSACPPDNGAYTAGEPVDIYQISGVNIVPNGTPTNPVSDRTIVHPDESELGVSLIFKYTSPTLSMINIPQDTQYTVVRLEPGEATP